ncbi:MAG: hypothetical protein A3F40_03785 [Chlamydiae bacterium RIFCSPHIGHO2_12_FULL_27_8]|nr:MAG: hypothetical protein A3F40_03785 [Chlamydiae bacterium RIFCSPHIGHO2_12_FULL_27_8]
MKDHILSIFTIAFSLFILMNSIGNGPLFLSLMKGISKQRQKEIVIREMLIALAIIIIFFFIGQLLLKFLGITPDALQIAGGVILFLVSLKILFPPEKTEREIQELVKITEPFIVPLAMPLIAGPAVLTAVILYAKQEPFMIVSLAIIIAWALSLAVLWFSAHLSGFFTERGLTAIERLMGFILILIAIQMFLNGVGSFMKA